MCPCAYRWWFRIDRLSANLLLQLTELSVIKGERESNLFFLMASQDPLAIDKEVGLKLKTERFSWDFPFLVAQALAHELILGSDFILHSQLVLNIPGYQIFFKFLPKYKISLTMPSANLLALMIVLLS